jgi:hypothetical protein
MWWIVLAVIVLVLGVYAFWPHKRGVADSEVRRSRRRDQGKVLKDSGFPNRQLPHL